MAALALADSKTLAAPPEVSIDCSVHIRGCGANVQSHVWACSNSTEKGTCTFDQLEAESLWNQDKVGMRMGDEDSLYQQYFISNESWDTMRLLLPHSGSSQVLEVSDTKCSFLWRTCLPCIPLVLEFFFPMSEEHWKTFCTVRRKVPEF